MPTTSAHPRPHPVAMQGPDLGVIRAEAEDAILRARAARLAAAEARARMLERTARLERTRSRAQARIGGPPG
jgi:hypothetical protein